MFEPQTRGDFSRGDVGRLIGVQAIALLASVAAIVVARLAEGKPLAMTFKELPLGKVVAFYVALSVIGAIARYIATRASRNRRFLRRLGLSGYLVTGDALRVVLGSSHLDIPVGEIADVGLWEPAKMAGGRNLLGWLHLGAAIPGPTWIYVTKRAVPGPGLRSTLAKILFIVGLIGAVFPLSLLVVETTRWFGAGPIPIGWVQLPLMFLVVIVLIRFQHGHLGLTRASLPRRIEGARLLTFIPSQGPEFVATLRTVLEKHRRNAGGVPPGPTGS
jgi:hypothetical protein